MTNDQQGSALDAELREDALDVVRDALEWQLTEGGWAGVAEVVDGLAVALRTGDAEAVRRGVYELELSGPVRATRIEDDSRVPPPARVRPILSDLVLALAGDEDDTGGSLAEPPAPDR